MLSQCVFHVADAAVTAATCTFCCYVVFTIIKKKKKKKKKNQSLLTWILSVTAATTASVDAFASACVPTRPAVSVRSRSRSDRLTDHRFDCVRDGCDLSNCQFIVCCCVAGVCRLISCRNNTTHNNQILMRVFVRRDGVAGGARLARRTGQRSPNVVCRL
jgi:hypothetical protein